MTLRDLLENVTVQGCVRIQSCGSGYKASIYYDGNADDIWKKIEEYGDKELTYIFPLDGDRICIEVEE
jgi:hypothetical protein